MALRLMVYNLSFSLVRRLEELREEDGTETSDWGNWSLEVTDASGNVIVSVNLGNTTH